MDGMTQEMEYTPINILEVELKRLKGRREYIKDQLSWNEEEKKNLQETLFKKQEEIINIQNAIKQLKG